MSPVAHLENSVPGSLKGSSISLTVDMRNKGSYWLAAVCSAQSKTVAQQQIKTDMKEAYNKICIQTLLLWSFV